LDDAVVPSDIELVARNIRRFRLERKLSLGQLAERAGLSKQTLSTVEQGQGNPTIETLSALAAALDVPTQHLVTVWGTPVYVQRAGLAAWQLGPRGRQRQFDEIYGSGYVRTLVIDLEAPNSSYVTSDPVPGTLHHVFVVSGRARLGPVDATVELEEGDFVRFPGDVSHLWESVGDRAVLMVVTTVPQSSQLGSIDAARPAGPVDAAGPPARRNRLADPSSGRG
jgi:transcriptional regulator with XRE-family HTH domain